MSTSELAAGRFDPEPTQNRVKVTAQLDDDHFVSPARHDGVGVYNVTLHKDRDIKVCSTCSGRARRSRPGTS